MPTLMLNAGQELTQQIQSSSSSELNHIAKANGPGEYPQRVMP
jgi:hypothetical protein